MLKARSMLEWTSDDIEAAITSSAEALRYDELTSNQSKVLQSFLSRSDFFVSLPSRSGKSLYYWVIPGAFNLLWKMDSSIVLVVNEGCLWRRSV